MTIGHVRMALRYLLDYAGDVEVTGVGVSGRYVSVSLGQGHAELTNGMVLTVCLDFTGNRVGPVRERRP